MQSTRVSALEIVNFILDSRPLWQPAAGAVFWHRIGVSSVDPFRCRLGVTWILVHVFFKWLTAFSRQQQDLFQHHTRFNPICKMSLFVALEMVTDTRTVINLLCCCKRWFHPELLLIPLQIYFMPPPNSWCIFQRVEELIRNRPILQVACTLSTNI